jgi:hypothetical protein
MSSTLGDHCLVLFTSIIFLALPYRLSSCWVPLGTYNIYMLSTTSSCQLSVSSMLLCGFFVFVVPVYLHLHIVRHLVISKVSVASKLIGCYVMYASYMLTLTVNSLF